MNWLKFQVVPALTVFLLFLTMTPAPAAEGVAVIPLFSAQRSVATGTAISGKSIDGLGVLGYSENGIAVWGQDAGTIQGRGYGGYFTSNTGIGVYGRSRATPTTSNAYTPGVYGSSLNGYGVYGYSDNSYGGYFTSDSGTGLSGVSRAASGSGVYGYSQNYYGGNFYSSSYHSLYASSPAGRYAGYFVNRGGSTSAGLYVNGTLVVTGAKSGYVVDIAINDGSDILETGDLVVISGYGDPVVGEIPLVRVRKCTTAESSAIAGVVDQPFTVDTSAQDGEKDQSGGASPLNPAASRAIQDEGSGIGSGAYLSIVTLGAYKAIKADATGGPIRPGSLLVASSEPGHAMAAEKPGCGTVIGKALGSLNSGTGLIPVMVTQQ